MTIRVKLRSPGEVGRWDSYFVGPAQIIDGVEFIFDPHVRDYDWLAVYEDLGNNCSEAGRKAYEVLACPPEHTLMITTEPESIKCYGYYFTRQFGHVLTSQPEWSLPHPRRHHLAALNHWFYGVSPESVISGIDLAKGPDPSEKQQAISMMFSPKAMRLTQHAKRFRFMKKMIELVPGLVVLGKGMQPIDDKRQALDRFKYHITLENHISPHHITEKLPDSFLGRCLTFYAGAPNAGEYFPERSFIPINMNDPEGTAALIQDMMGKNAWEDSLPDIEEARQRVLTQHNPIAAIARIVREHHRTDTKTAAKEQIIYGRHAWRQKHPLSGLKVLAEKTYVQIRASRMQREYQ